MRRRTVSILPGVGLHGAQNTLATAVDGGGWAPVPIAGLLLATIIAASRRPAIGTGAGAPSTAVANVFCAPCRLRHQEVRRFARAPREQPFGGEDEDTTA